MKDVYSVFQGFLPHIYHKGLGCLMGSHFWPPKSLMAFLRLTWCTLSHSLAVPDRWYFFLLNPKQAVKNLCVEIITGNRCCCNEWKNSHEEKQITLHYLSQMEYCIIIFFHPLVVNGDQIITLFFDTIRRPHLATTLTFSGTPIPII